MTGNRVARLRRVLGALCALVGITAIAGSAAPASGPAETAAKPVVCKKGQVRVTTLGKTRCKPLRPAAPTADQRLPLLRGVIGQNFGTVQTRRGRRIPALSSTAGGRTRRVQARLIRSLPKILAWADSRARTTANRTHAAGPCGLPPGQSTSNIDGFQISLSNSGDLTVNAAIPGGFRIEVFVGSALPCGQLELPACPKADGSLDGTDVHQNRVSMRVTQNGALVQSITTNVRSTQTMRGKVADDAKLDTMTLTDTSTESMTVRVPGDQYATRLTVRRSAEVDMRTGSPRGTPTVRASFQIVGATQTLRAAVGADVQRKYEESFPSLISEEVRNYRSREAAWQTAGACAKLTFNPPSGSPPALPKDATGPLFANVESTQGGVAAKARWKVNAQSNGTFSPQEAQGGSTTFQYTVTNAGVGLKLSGTFRATSTAGVAEASWSRETKPTINRIVGTFGGRFTAQTMLGPSVIDFNGSLTFDRSSFAISGGADGAYHLSNGGYTVSFSGIDASGATGCQMSGAGSFAIPAGPVFGSITVFGAQPNADPPYGYTWIALPAATDRVTVTRHSCPSGGNGTTVELNTFGLFGSTSLHTSDDGITYQSSENQPAQVINWSFTGTE